MGQPKAPATHEKQMVALGRILQSLREEESLESLVAATVAHVEAAFSYTFLWVGLYDRIQHRLYGRGGLCAQGSRFLKQQIVLTPGDLMEQVVIQQRPVMVPDLRAEQRVGEWSSVAKSVGVQGALLFPIRFRDRCIGMMLLGSERWGISPSAGERAHLSLVLGSLAEAIDRLEQVQQRQQAKRPEVPLFALLDTLRSLPSLEDRLKTVAGKTQEFIAADRTNIYWIDSEQHRFWQRVSSRSQSRITAYPVDHPQGVTFGIEEVRGFHQSLQNGQLVVIGEAQSSLKMPITGRLMEAIKARSLLAAPIIFQDELLGFVAAEGDTPRIWLEPEKTYLQGVARLLSLAMPLAEMEKTLTQVKSDQFLTAGIVRSMHSQADWRKTLDACAVELKQRLGVTHLLVLLYDAERGGFEVTYHSDKVPLRHARTPWLALDDVDWRMLEQSQAAIAIEDLEYDLKLMAWRDALLDMEVRSLLVCNVSLGHPPDGLVIACSNSRRHWLPTDHSLIEVVSQQVGLILHQWQLQRQAGQQDNLYDTIQWGLRNLQRTFQPDQLEQVTLSHINQLLQVPLVALVTWRPEDTAAQISQHLIRDTDFGLQVHQPIPVGSDALINWALQTDGLLTLSLEDLPDPSRQWLHAPTDSKLIVAALRTAPEHSPNAILLLADLSQRRWSDYHLHILTVLVNQLAWSRRHLTLVEMLTTQREELEQLNWYKHHRVEEIYRTLEACLRRLNELTFQKDGFSSQRYQQTLRQMGGLLTSLNPLMRQEQWQLHTAYETTPLVSLLSRLLERVGPLVQKQQLWTKVHNDTNLSLGGDIPKIEFVLHELMAAACDRSQPGGRIDIWCRPLDRRWLELSITDHGTVNPVLLEELSSGRSEDLLFPSALDQPPGLHYAICQALMQQMGGEFTLSKLEDNRIMSRVLLPIASGTPVEAVKQEGPTSKPFSRQDGR
jgi:GAF domain-containing protein